MSLGAVDTWANLVNSEFSATSLLPEIETFLLWHVTERMIRYIAFFLCIIRDIQFMPPFDSPNPKLTHTKNMGN